MLYGVVRLHDFLRSSIILCIGEASHKNRLEDNGVAEDGFERTQHACVSWLFEHHLFPVGTPTPARRVLLGEGALFVSVITQDVLDEDRQEGAMVNEPLVQLTTVSDELPAVRQFTDVSHQERNLM